MRKIWMMLLAMGSVFLLLSNGCKKDFLEIKPSTDIVQPIRLDEFQKLLQNAGITNVTAAMGVLAADEYIYSSAATWQSARTAAARNSYIWAADLYEGEESRDWNVPYSAIFYANNVLAGLDKIEITATNQKEWNDTKGWALFVRAFAYYELVNTFAPPYDALTASADLGVPLRLKPSIDELLQRSTVQQTFDQILADLSQATLLLNDGMPAGRTRPSKVAAHALFARIYLNMRNYTHAELHADSCLALYSKLIDFNTLNKTSSNPFIRNHDEQIYAKQGVLNASHSNGSNPYIEVNSELIDLYEPNDLRLQIYFLKQADGSYDMKSGYFGPGLNPFMGLATDEVYLIKSECAAKRGEINIAMKKLNELRVKRWNPNATTPARPYVHTVATDIDDAVDKVLLERRRELVWRGQRWDDLKRLNKEGANITLTRVIDGKTFALPPNDPRYVFPIPDNEINLSGIEQNQR